MDHASEGPGGPAVLAAAAPRARPRLAVVNGGLRLCEPAAPLPADWRSAMTALAQWLEVPVQHGPAPAPVFAPWTAWCPAAFQNGGAPDLPEALFAASYAIEHPRAVANPRARGVDVMLLSPHPVAARCGGMPLAETIEAMRAAAGSEGRERIAILLPARHRAAMSPGTEAQVDTLTPEEALPLLLRDPARWEAIIALPEQRGMIFALLAEVTGVRGPWPMLWHGRAGLAAITAEALAADGGAGDEPLPLDATLLAHALTLALREAGLSAAALRLHTAWTQLRGRGVTTPARGDPAPYATEVPEAEFIAMLSHCSAAPRHPQTSPWQALKNQPGLILGNPAPTLRIVSANLASF